MATCPRDGALIDVDYGMATCPTCGVMLFIDMEGVAHLGGDADAPTPPPIQDDSEPIPEITQVIESDQVIESNQIVSDQIVEGEFQEITFEPGYNPVEENPSGEPAPLINEPDSSPADPLGIQAYANSEISSAKDGPMLYRLLISGIDTKEIRESLREAITDSRFGWDVDAIMRSIAHGELRIENVSPVKASVAVNRLKRLPVRIRWEQYAVTQAEQL